jgi:hypothetical protein
MKDTTDLKGFKEKETYNKWKATRNETLVDFSESIPYVWKALTTDDIISDPKAIKDKKILEDALKKCNVQRKSEARSSAAREWYKKVGDFRKSNTKSDEEKAVDFLISRGYSEEEAKIIINKAKSE